MNNPPANTAFVVRRATTADVKVMARHRCEMFKDMGRLREDAHEQLAAAAESYFLTAMPDGEYLHWLAAPQSDPAQIVSGGGMQLRYNLPSLDDQGRLRPSGPQGLIVNVYTEPEWRQRGLANIIMQAIIKWSQENNVQSLVLHASVMGRPIYEKMGFVASNEMVYPYDLLRQSGVTSQVKSEQVFGEELARLLDKIDALPFEPHPDGRTDIAVNHDDILYPKEDNLKQ